MTYVVYDLYGYILAVTPDLVTALKAAAEGRAKNYFPKIEIEVA